MTSWNYGQKKHVCTYSKDSLIKILLYFLLCHDFVFCEQKIFASSHIFWNIWSLSYFLQDWLWTAAFKRQTSIYQKSRNMLVKFTYCEKATKFCEFFTLLLSYVLPAKSKVKISQSFVAFSEYMNFISIYLCTGYVYFFSYR